jgi:hypothetical protein
MLSPGVHKGAVVRILPSGTDKTWDWGIRIRICEAVAVIRYLGRENALTWRTDR